MKLRSRAVAVCAAAAATTSLVPGIAQAETKTPIDHVVVIYSENISFDHYFGTYPHAANNDDEKLQGSEKPAPKFTAKDDTPRAENLENTDLLGGEEPQLHQAFPHRSRTRRNHGPEPPLRR